MNSIKISLAMLALTSLTAAAENPIIQTNFTADPAPLANGDRLYLYTSHDEDGATWFEMNNWKLYSTEDMVNWTDHGIVMKYNDFDWGKSDAWAPQCIERDGRYYLYVPLTSKENGRSAIGVGVSDSPFGPFYDPLGKPLVQSDWGDIDPTVMVDDDGQAYLYWGNPLLKYVRLNDDMISYRGEIMVYPNTEEAFSKRDNDAKRPTLYEEGPWLYKRNGLYYLFWAGGPLPEHIGYSTSTSPEGPWVYGGNVMTPEGGVFTNHPGVVDFKGKTYFFYHDGSLPGGGGFDRSVCVEEMKFDDKGNLILPIERSKKGIDPITTLNPYRKNEAETMAWSEGMKASQNEKVGVFVTAMKDSAYIKVRNVDFGDRGATSISVRAGSVHNSNVCLEVHTDAPNGPLVAKIDIPFTGGNDRWRILTTEIEPLTGIKDIYFVSRGKAPSRILHFDYWMFSE